MVGTAPAIAHTMEVIAASPASAFPEAITPKSPLWPTASGELPFSVLADGTGTTGGVAGKASRTA